VSNQNEFYLQDSRNYVGNDVLWWAKDGAGYTTDLRNAHIYTKDQAVSKHRERESDIPWPKYYIDNKTRPAVDMQVIRIDDALLGTGIVLIKTKPERIKKQSYRCNKCGIFMSEKQYFVDICHNCGFVDNH